MKDFGKSRKNAYGTLRTFRCGKSMEQLNRPKFTRKMAVEIKCVYVCVCATKCSHHTR